MTHCAIGKAHRPEEPRVREEDAESMGRREDVDQIREEDDHDLLTFGESGIRLREAIALTEPALVESGAGAQAALNRDWPPC